MNRTLPWIALSLLAACSQDSAAGTTGGADILKRPLGLEGVELTNNPDNPLSAAKAELGRQLFFDPRLSGSGTMACAACHLPEQAFTDGKALSVKDDGKTNTRNAPTMHNVGYYERLYWDGRAKGLEANVLAAWKAQIAGKPDEAAARLSKVEAYKTAFQQAFGEGPSEKTVVHALASFLRSLRSGDSAYDRWKAGQKDAIAEAAQKGHDLFMGKAGCIVCHTPPLFTDRIFHNVGIGSTAEKPDIGAAAENALNDASRTGAFKTPTLRDIAKTAPYFHDGSVASLRDAVKLMASGGIANPHKDPLLLDRGLTDAEIDQLVAFLETLSGNVPFTAPAVPK
ncbi:MAG: c-type cytochrome [Planctomycetes bacterium]|nr:c-type cytochrome [Planctomycetota bacterium]